MERHKLDWLILTATRGEQETILESTGGIEPTVLSHRPAVLGQISGQSVAIVSAGIGAVNTAQALTAVLERTEVGCVLQTGIGGAFRSSGLVVGDVAVATEEIAGEFGVITEDGWLDGSTIGIPLIESDPPVYNHISLDADVSARALAAAAIVSAESTAQTGPFLTVQNVTGSDAVADELDDRFGAICENMEGFAAAQICQIYDVPFCEIRGISNTVETRDLSKWDIPEASRIAQLAALELIRG